MTPRISFFRTFPVIAALMLGAAPFVMAPGLSVAMAEEKAADPVIAKVNGQDIKMSEVTEFVSTLPPQMSKAPIEQIFPLIQDQLVNGRLISERAAKANMAEDPEVKSRIKFMTDNIIRGTFLEREVKSSLTDAAVKKAYDDFIKGYKADDEVHAQHILVDDEAKAKEVITKLDKGTKFEDLVKEYSKDKGAKEDGDLGYFRAGEMVKEFSDAAFALKKGQHSKAPVKTAFGYHVINVLDRRKVEPPKFDDVKEQIKGDLQQKNLQSIVEGYRKGATIELFDMKGQPVKKADAAPEKK